MVVFEGKNEFKTYKKITFSVLNRSMARFIIPLSVFILAVGILFLFLRDSMGVFFTVFGAIYAPLVYLVMFFQAKMHYKSNKLYFDSVAKTTFSDKIYTEQTSSFGSQSMAVTYESLNKVYIFKDTAAFYLSNRSLMMVDLKQLTEGTLDELIELLKTNHVKLKTKN